MMRHSRALVTAVNRVRRQHLARYRYDCPFCPASSLRGHNKNCPMVALFKASDEFVRVESFIHKKKARKE